ncbi:MAG: nucleoside-triphosphatase [Anaerolineales bacterium]
MGWNWKGDIPVQDFINSPESLLASFNSRQETGRLILITGPSGSGKTCWCLELVKLSRASGYVPAGLVSPAVFKDNLKVGIDLLNLVSDEQRHLALQRSENPGDHFPAHWSLNPEVLEWGNGILGQLTSCNLLILDELGPLELDRGGGLTNGIELVARRGYRLACVVIRPSLVGTAWTLWPWAEIYHIPYDFSTGTPT